MCKKYIKQAYLIIFIGVITMGLFYVYGHFDKQENLKYIGCGKGVRAIQQAYRSDAWNEYFKDYFPTLKFFKKDLSKEEAFILEKKIIKESREQGINLLNRTDGGQGGYQKEYHPMFGKTHSEETKNKIAASKKLNPSRYWLGKKRDPELIKKMVAASHSPEAIEKSRLKRIGRKLPIEQVERHREFLRNLPRTPEWNANISKAKIGKPNGLEGRVMSLEHRQKISEARITSEKVKASGSIIWEARRKNGTANNFTTSKAKAVKCLETNIIYRCAKEAAEMLKLSDKHIQACCTGKRETHGKLRWAYV
jgi:hypothetical protein